MVCSHLESFVHLMALSRGCALAILLIIPVPLAAVPLVCAQPAGKAAAVQRNLLPAGSYHALVIFARFADESASDDASGPSFARALFDPDRPGSLTHFFDEMSGGQLRLTGEALPRWYVSSQPSSAYVGRDSARGYRDFVPEILAQVDADVDLGAFDNDGPDGRPNSGDDDGFVDLIFINLQTTPTGFIRGGATGVANLGLDRVFTSDDKGVEGVEILIRSDSDRVAAAGTLQRGHTFELAVGSMAHEFGHLMGLPDLYDLDFNSAAGTLEPRNDSAGIGYWGLMGHGALGWNEVDGPNPLSVWSLGQLGWLGPGNSRLITVTENMRDLAITDVRKGGNVYRLPGRGASNYYLVVHRRPGSSYYERNLPGSGLLIWEIDEEQLTNNIEQAKLIDLVTSDGRFLDAGFPLGKRPAPDSGLDNLDFWAHDENYRREYGGNLGDGTDFFDGVVATDFWVGSNPSPVSGTRVGNIRRDGDVMTADLLLDDPHRAGRIDDDVRWDGEVVVVGDIVVNLNGRLFIGPGAQVRVDRDLRGTGRDPERVEFIVDGELSTGARLGSPATITSAADDPRPGDWYGISIESTGRVTLINTHIQHVHIGVAGRQVNEDQVLKRVQISGATHSGVQISQLVGILSLSEVSVTQADSSGVSVIGTGSLTVAASTFVSNGLTGLSLEGGRIRLLNSRFVDNGLQHEAGANLVLGPGGRGIVSENQLSGGVGILCRASREVRIVDNKMSDGRIGLISSSSRPWVENNLISGNELAIQVSGLEVPAFLRLNTIEGSERLVESTAMLDLNARNNWWGRDEEDWIGERMTGVVFWQPILNVDPRLTVEFDLAQNYPNPFNGSTVIDYAIGIETPILANALDLDLQVRNVAGALVRQLVYEKAAPGRYSISWDGRSDDGQPVASGVYVYVLRVGPIVRSQRLMLLK